MESQSTAAMMKLRDLIMCIDSKIDSMNTRVEHLEAREPKKMAPAVPDNTKGTQTESDSAMHPPACIDAVRLWEEYEVSKKSDTQILIEALKSMNIKHVIDQQNSKMTEQTNMLNSLNRTFSQMAKHFSPKTSTDTKQTIPTKKHRQNASSSKKIRNPDD